MEDLIEEVNRALDPIARATGVALVTSCREQDSPTTPSGPRERHDAWAYARANATAGGRADEETREADITHPSGPRHAAECLGGGSNAAPDDWGTGIEEPTVRGPQEHVDAVLDGVAGAGAQFGGTHVALDREAQGIEVRIDIEGRPTPLTLGANAETTLGAWCRGFCPMGRAAERDCSAAFCRIT